MNLHALFERAVRRFPRHPAAKECNQPALNFSELGALSDAVRDRLIAAGINPGDRVGVYLPKSVDSIAAIIGILKTGAAYVPVDPLAPPARNTYVLQDCGIAALFIESSFLAAFTNAWEGGILPEAVFEVSSEPCGRGLTRLLAALDQNAAAPICESVKVSDQALAYILYTSGSTGRPKGVMLSHENATAFVNWCGKILEPVPEDRFSSHAPFHFDLSILDVYAPLSSGACVVLFQEELGKDPLALAKAISDERISIWYSAPSILTMLSEFGKLYEKAYDSLRWILFAGEVFPVAHLRKLTRSLVGPRYLNLYGPTETNVCTYHEIDLPIPDSRTAPYPIGRVCEHLESIVLREDGTEARSGEEGELCIRGPNVMRGYWNLQSATEEAFVNGYYRTGDIVVDQDGVLNYRGRRDRMIKKRGYRIELGEIESALHTHPDVHEAAVVARVDEEKGVIVIAHVALLEKERISSLALRKVCAKRLPTYMIPDEYRFHEMLPKTSTAKIDYQSLIAME